MIYFIQDDNAIKIGYTKNHKNLEQRFQTLQIGNYRELKIIQLIHGTMYLEKELHKLFDDEWIRGEWFKLSDRLKSILGG